MKQRLAASVAAIATTALSGYWVAAGAAAPPAKVHFAGCVKAGVEAGCLIVESGGKTFNISSAKTRVTVGHFAAGTGVPGAMSACMEGDALSDVVLDNPPAQDPCVKDNHPTATH